MGTFKWPLRISSMDGQQAQEIEATVDPKLAQQAARQPTARAWG